MRDKETAEIALSLIDRTPVMSTLHTNSAVENRHSASRHGLRLV